MNILHINSYYTGASLYKNLYDKEKQLGLNISVYVPHSNKFKNSRKDFGEYTTLSLDFTNFDRLLFFRKHKKIFSNIQKTYDISKFDLIHAHSLFSNGYIAYKLHQKFNVPYIVAIRNTDVNVFFKKMIHLRKLGRRIIDNAEKVIFISDSYKKTVLDKYIKSDRIDTSGKYEVIPNGIDDFWLENIYRGVRKIENKTVRILCVGDIDKNKNHTTTLKACELLYNNGYNVTFNIVGRILDKNIFRKLSQSRIVNYLGTMNKEELLTEYRNSDIFVMPSYTETFGLVYAEAMSQGLPVIYTKNQGFDKQFKDGIVGFHVDADDIDMISEAIVRILREYKEMSNNCTNLVNGFDWMHIVKRYCYIYDKIIL